MIFYARLDGGILATVSYQWALIDNTLTEPSSTGVTQPVAGISLFRIDAEPPANARDLIVVWEAGPAVMSVRASFALAKAADKIFAAYPVPSPVTLVVRTDRYAADESFAYRWIIDGVAGSELTTGLSTLDDGAKYVHTLEVSPPNGAEELVVYDSDEPGNSWQRAQFVSEIASRTINTIGEPQPDAPFVFNAPAPVVTDYTFDVLHLAYKFLVNGAVEPTEYRDGIAVDVNNTLRINPSATLPSGFQALIVYDDRKPNQWIAIMAPLPPVPDVDGVTCRVVGVFEDLQTAGAGSQSPQPPPPPQPPEPRIGIPIAFTLSERGRAKDTSRQALLTGRTVMGYIREGQLFDALGNPYVQLLRNDRILPSGTKYLVTCPELGLYGTDTSMSEELAPAQLDLSTQLFDLSTIVT